MMVAREFHLDQEAEDPFEAEETLSLSDLPITGDSAQWDDSYSKKEENVEDDDDFFEFISEDFTASTRAATIEKDIIFCGKIISPYIESSTDAKQSNTLNQNGNNGSILLPWIPNKPASKPATSLYSTFNKGRELKDSMNLKGNYSGGRVSLMKSATKSRWYLFMFGMSSIRLPAEMELSDIRSRQRRRNAPATTTTFSAPAGGEVVRKSNKGRKNVWFGKMLRSLGLGCSNSKQANDVVKSFISMNLSSAKTSTCWHVPRAGQS